MKGQAMPHEHDGASFDPRPWFITLCFVEITLCASLFIFLLMENSSESSFLGLVNDLMTYSQLSAAILALSFVLVAVSVVSVWIRNPRLLSVASLSSTVLILMLGFVLVWVTQLSKGHWDADLEQAFWKMNANSTCPTLAGDKCCGWTKNDTVCNATACPFVDTPCKRAVDNGVRDFYVRVLPITAIITVTGLIGCVVSCLSRSWVSAVGSPGGEYDPIH
jgi:hypothetical protein